MKDWQINKILECLKELSDKSFQEKVWIKQETAEVSSCDELLSQLFDDTGLEDELEKGKTVFNAEIDEKLKTIGNEIVQIRQEKDENEVLEHPKWNSVIDLATNVRMNLQLYIKNISK